MAGIYLQPEISQEDQMSLDIFFITQFCFHFKKKFKQPCSTS